MITSNNSKKNLGKPGWDGMLSGLEMWPVEDEGNVSLHYKTATYCAILRKTTAK